MTYTSIGDLAQTFRLRHETGQAKSALARLGQEVASGRAADPAKRQDGDFAPLAGVERGLSLMTSVKTAIDETGAMLSRMQVVLGRVQSEAGDLSGKLLGAAASGQRTQIDTVAAQAGNGLDAAISSLNARLGGRALFAGAATDAPALMSGPQMRSELRAAAGGASTAQDVAAAVDAWFASGGGFEQNGYLGSDTSAGPYRIGRDAAVDPELTAADPAIRETLAGLGMAVLLEEGVLSDDLTEAGRLAEAAGERLLASEAGLAAMRGRLGETEARVDTAAARTDAEIGALEIARDDLAGVDPYEAVTRLQATRTQLETLHTLTARLANLSLASYLR